MKRLQTDAGLKVAATSKYIFHPAGICIFYEQNFIIMSVAKSLRGIVNKIKTSIAFYPALIVLGFLGMAFFMIQFDFSESGKQLKSDLPWLSLKDASTARVIISTIVAGIISLTVFSFSMVMIVLNQAASQMSNRMLSSMIENRFQQITLGIYIGTIVYSLFLLSTIRDIHAGVYVPALSIYLLILITVTDIFLFIYFLEYVTQSVKYSNIIQRVKARTLAAMKTSYSQDHPGSAMFLTGNPVIIATWQSGYLQNIDINQIVKLASKLKLQVQVLQKKGSFLPEGIPFLAIYGKTPVDESIRNDIKEAFDFFNGQPIGLNPEYGFSHITEVAVRALSPGVNDPGTAVLCIH
ncbi:MAG: DUF2254 domain-containing protein, partial [Chitinophagaceae bacterium]